MSKDDNGLLDWSLPVMRAGYAGRGLTYLVVAGISLWAIFRGGQAQGTESAMAVMADNAFGRAVVIAAAIGLIAYAIWRLLDAVFDLEAYGTEAKGIVARLGMIVTGLVHAALGVGVASTISGGSGSGGSGSGSGAEGGSSGGGGVAGAVQTVLEWPGGRWIVMIAGLLTLGAAVYYAIKAYKASYREHLFANEATRRWNDVLRAGVAAQAVLVAVAGGMLVVAGFRADSSEAGGIGEVFDWLQSQPFGQVLVVAVCIGLLGFALFCFVNAAYRIIPVLHEGDGPETLADSMRQARAA